MVTGEPKALRKVRRLDSGAVFQDPMTSLNPTMRIGRQVTEAAGSPEEALRLLTAVGIPDPKRRMRAFPHELSGGLRQRVMIAMAVAGDPELIIADEPTTALDVTVQAQVLRLLKRLRDEIGCSIVLITHDLGVAAQISDRIAVLYAGRIAEIGPTAEVLGAPAHPYTHGLLHQADAGHRARSQARRARRFSAQCNDVAARMRVRPRAARSPPTTAPRLHGPHRCRARPGERVHPPTRRHRGPARNRVDEHRRAVRGSRRGRRGAAAIGGVQERDEDVHRLAAVAGSVLGQPRQAACATRGFATGRPRRVGGAGRGEWIGQVHAVADHRRAGESHVRVGGAGRRQAAADGVPGCRRIAHPVAVGG